MRALGMTADLLGGDGNERLRGCNEFSNTGNRGRFGVFEILSLMTRRGN